MCTASVRPAASEADARGGRCQGMPTPTTRMLLWLPAGPLRLLPSASHSELRPPMEVNRKSRLLSTCLRSVFALPLLNDLEKHTCLFLEPPNIQVRPCSGMPASGLGGGSWPPRRQAGVPAVC